jgi:chromosomal replication initiation ATPase DnaA
MKNLKELIKRNEYLSMKDMYVTLFDTSDEKLKFINNVICSYFNRPNNFLKIKGKSVENKVIGRQVLIYIIRERTDITYKEVVDYLKYKSSQPFMYSYDKVKGKVNKPYPNKIKNIICSIEQILEKIKSYE